MRHRFINLRASGVIALMMVSLVAPLGLPAPVIAASHSISSCADLQTLGANASTSADTLMLTTDLDCTGISFGSMYSAGFSGTFDGRGHTIAHIDLNSPGTYNNGLFSSTNGATITDVTLTGSVTGSNATGALIGVAADTTVTNVTSSVNVAGVGSLVGGLIGQMDNPGTSLIQDVTVTGDVTAPSSGGGYVGGLIGYLTPGDGSHVTLDRVSYTGDVSVGGGAGGTRVGGLIGMAYASGSSASASVTIQDSYVSGTVHTTVNEVGGVIGAAIARNSSGGNTSNITLSRVYSDTDVVGTAGVGGLFGIGNSVSSTDHLVINHSFAVGHVSGTADLGGLVGANSADPPSILSITGGYFDGPGTAQTNCAGLLAPTGTCTRINTATQPSYFKANHANAPLSTWDFSTVWTTRPGSYPTLIPVDDGDGISKVDEAAAPNDGDANGDGIADAAQPGVASFPNHVSGQYAVLQSSCGQLFNTAVGAESTAAGQTDAAYTYPGGLIRFIATGCTPGATATVTQQFYGLSDPSQFTMRKSINDSYTTIPGATFSMVAIGGQSVLQATYAVTDGSSLDDDGAANGDIVDPAGPATGVLGVPNTGLGGHGPG